MKMPFGKHKGKSLDEVPALYLLWCSRQKWIRNWPTLYRYIRYSYDRLLLEQEDLDAQSDFFDGDKNELRDSPQ